MAREVIVAVAALWLTGVCGGPLLARVRRDAWRRLLGWGGLGGLMAAAHLVLADSDALERMVGLCLVLLGAMKAVVYADWARGRRLPPGRYLAFALLWLGMNPGEFRRRVPGLEWKGDMVLGAALCVSGLAACACVQVIGWRQALVMFAPMSLAFHFGVLRMLKGLLRAVGFPVRTLFRNVLVTRGLGDFWGRRWNVGYSQMLQRVVGRPVEDRLGPSAGLVSVFLLSGLIHECAITLPVGSGFGGPTAYFAVQGVLTLVERRWGAPFGPFPTLVLVALPVGWLFPPGFREEVMERCLSVFDWL